jgi:dTDP-4-dehydrorhamnose 3,5-epimerase
MQLRPTRLPEVQVVEPRVFGDSRGFFLESWNQRAFDEMAGTEVRFVQDNHSRSARGVLRGLHYQHTRPQGKLVRVTAGRVFDVAVDLRRSSPRLGQWVGMELSADDKRGMWIPPGFAHGFLVLSEYADFLYKTTDYYVPSDERAIAWNDPEIGVEWPLQDVGGSPTLSGKDQAAKGWRDADLFD